MLHSDNEDAAAVAIAQSVDDGDSGQTVPAAAPAVQDATEQVNGIDKSALAFPEPRRIRDKEHLRFVATQPCLICGRCPCDPHHLRFAQTRALGRRASDEFTVPLCRGHHRELHRSGNEATWWKKSGIDPMPAARVLWLKTHPVCDWAGKRGTSAKGRTGSNTDVPRNRSPGKPRRNSETKPIAPSAVR
jgi:hypothetical protein